MLKIVELNIYTVYNGENCIAQASKLEKSINLFPLIYNSSEQPIED